MTSLSGEVYTGCSLSCHERSCTYGDPTTSREGGGALSGRTMLRNRDPTTCGAATNCELVIRLFLVGGVVSLHSRTDILSAARNISVVPHLEAARVVTEVVDGPLVWTVPGAPRDRAGEVLVALLGDLAIPVLRLPLQPCQTLPLLPPRQNAPRRGVCAPDARMTNNTTSLRVTNNTTSPTRSSRCCSRCLSFGFRRTETARSSKDNRYSLF
eukprot:4337544-Pyramimonas_sp.AAC.1